jgi:hypothetical protein
MAADDPAFAFLGPMAGACRTAAQLDPCLCQAVHLCAWRARPLTQCCAQPTIWSALRLAGALGSAHAL